MTKPVIILVPGCWHVPAHFEHTQRNLETAGYTCVGVDLPGNNEPGRTMNDDISAVRNAILKQLDGESDVVVVTHSYSSIPGTAAVAGLGAAARRAAGKSTHVRRVVVIAGFLLPPGTTMLAVMGGQLAPQYLHDQEADHTLPFNGPGATHVLYQDLDQLELEKAIWRLKPQSFAINTSITPDQIAALDGIPVSYLVCRNDNAVPPPFQAQTVQGYRAAGIEAYAEVAESGHSPFIKLPGKTAKFISKAAGEDTQTGFASFDAAEFSM